MQKSTEVITSVSATITSTSLSSMVIFNDPIYLHLAIISGFVGLLSALNDLDEIKKLKFSFYAFFITFKGAFIGFFSAPFIMITLVLFGEQIAKKANFTIEENNVLLISFYWLASLLFSRLIAKIIFNYLENKSDDK